VGREFSDQVMDHFMHPRYGRPLPWPDGTGWAQNHDRSRFIRIQVNLDEGRVSQIGFSTHGCAPAIACGSWVCEWAFQRPVEAVNRLTSAEVLGALGGLPEHRTDHADLSVRALHEAVAEAMRKKGGPSS
jgi:NifU-like protein involved in Fe-S cluster formation